MADQDPRPDPQEERIGTDEWVAQADERHRAPLTGPLGRIATAWERIPLGGRYGLVLALLIVAPFATGWQPFLDLIGSTNNAFMITVGARFLVFALLAIGLNVVVGYTGLLDLGYTAFYGIAGYLYAYSASSFVQTGSLDGLHLPSFFAVPLIVLVTAGIGWLIGSVSLRLSGDYLAIVTLGFGQVFVQLALTATRVPVFWRDRPVNFTRGPNGINRLDDISLFGFTFDTTIEYYYLLLALVALVYLAVYRINRSRIGRAWRAIRDDELAAEVMGIPTGRMKLLAFAIGAGIAALAGSVDAAWQGSVVPVPRYSVLTLINLYAMVVLGGIGSLAGVVLGAFIFTVLPEVLRSITLASLFFYGFSLVGLWVVLRARRFALVVGGTVLAGLVLKLIAVLLQPGWGGADLDAGSWLNRLVQSWLILPENVKVAGNIVTVLAIAVLLAAVLLRRRVWAFHTLLGIGLYMFAFAWETRLAVEPSATRILIIGVTLVVLMIVRPQGLLGKPEVRVT